MTDFELKSKLKSVPVPERGADYWEHFPTQIRGQLRRESIDFSRQNWHPRFAWAGSLAFALALFFFCHQFHPLQTASLAITKQEKKIHRQFARLDTGLHVLMFNPHGMGYLLAEAN